METLIKDVSQTKNNFEVTQKEKFVQSINKAGTIFHYIDLSYINQNVFLHAWLEYRSN